MSEPLLITEPEAAKILGVSKETLARIRKRGTGPTWIKITSGLIRYRPEDLTRFIQSRATGGTCEAN
jgi:predicted DNA-binding transcriptional regulator AlpA